MRKRYWLGAVVSAVLIFLMIRQVDLAAVVRALGEANLIFLLPAVALYFSGVFVRAVRWAVLLAPLRKIRPGRLFVVQVVGFMANDILPLRAGEGVRAFMLWRKERVAPGATLATIVVERIFDGLALTGFILLASLSISLDSWLTQLAWAATGLFILGIGGVVALTFAPSPLLSLAARLLSPMPHRLRDLGLGLMRTFVDGLSIVRSARSTAAVALLSLAAWLLEAGMYYVLMFSFPFLPRFEAAILGTAVANLASMVPSSPGYVGTFDLALLTVLVGTFGIDPSVSAAYTALVHYAVLIVPVVLVGVLFVWREGLTLRRIAEQGAYGQQERGDATGRAEAAP